MAISELTLYQQAILLLAGLIALTSFLMLGQSRLVRLVLIFALQGCLLAAATALAAAVLDYPHLYVSAVLSFLLKGLVIPILLHRLIRHMGLHRVMDTVDHPARVMMAGTALVVFSYYVSLPVVQHSTLVTLNAIAVSLAAVLLGMLLMITRRQAVAHVVGFMSIENGLFFAAVVSTYGMPMVVELGVAFDVLVAAVVFGVFFFQIRSSIDSLNVDQLSKLSEADQ
ncbi:formate hydrogenlyase [Methylococcus geothermalis]|uniref:Formate hydrogenlyase n=1 Tax=Methylococcus geothermalis TaxID=2681310 RepID=A0A858Q9S4_9GAMM|nr:formate hydrogenlyase [Methylococcus geothermalis]QJD30629.1 formate hydrogenlyase [Methylococcus geothermalis]